MEHIRNHAVTSIDFSGSLNILSGPNGAGKTSVLEAISIAGLSKSFLPVTDSTILNRNEQQYFIKITAETDLNIPYFSTVKYERNGKRTICNSFADNILAKDLIGQLPIVVLSPDLKSITFGPPQERRNMLDRILSQSYKSYLISWMKLKKILRNRSKILSENLKTGILDKNLLNVWTSYLIDISSEIIFRRAEFVRSFSDMFISLYSDLSGSKEPVSLHYNAFEIKDLSSIESIREQIVRTSENYHNEEIRRGTNLFGPQRDDLNFMINGGNAREFASQGQHKTLLNSY